jgi:glutathione peroxidase-family protein
VDQERPRRELPGFSTIDVNGTGKAPLYAWLTEQATQPAAPEVRQSIESALDG